MTKFYLWEKKAGSSSNWICKKQIKSTISLAKIDTFTFNNDNKSYKIETSTYDIDKDLLQVYLTTW